MGTEDLEDLLRIHPFRPSESRWKDAVTDAISRIALLPGGYAVVGTTEMGVYARPRFTEQIQLALSRVPPNTWLEALRHADYRVCKCGVWTLDSLRLSISVPQVLRPLFGRENRLAEAKDVFWIYLGTGELPEAISEVTELISSCPRVVEELRADLAIDQNDLVSRLDRWTERLRFAHLSSADIISGKVEQISQD